MSTMTFNCPYLNINNVPIKVNHLHVGNETSSTAIKKGFLMIFSFESCSTTTACRGIVGENSQGEIQQQKTFMSYCDWLLYPYLFKFHSTVLMFLQNTPLAVGSCCDFEETWLVKWTNCYETLCVCLRSSPRAALTAKKPTEQVLKSCPCHFSRFECHSNRVLPGWVQSCSCLRQSAPGIMWSHGGGGKGVILVFNVHVSGSCAVQLRGRLWRRRREIFVNAFFNSVRNSINDIIKQKQKSRKDKNVLPYTN